MLSIYGISQNPDTKDYVMVFEDGFCENCGKQYTNIKYKWCKLCLNYFTNCTNGNKRIDDLIQEMQSRIENYKDIVFEWVPYNQFKNIKVIDKNSTFTLFSAIWADGPLKFDINTKTYKRNRNEIVTFKCLHN